MRAVVYTHYGPPEVLQLAERPTPVPRAHEILVQVHASAATIGDARMRAFRVPQGQWLFARLYLGVWGPRRQILGMSLAGDVTAVGADVTRFKRGDAVLASTFNVDFGGYAEYKCLPQDGLVVIKPPNVTYAEAAAIPAGSITALRCLRQGNIRPGQQVLIYGASGAVGTYAVQLARHFGAEVTAVCGARHRDLLRGLGVTKVIDYAAEDFAAAGPSYDVVFDAVHKLDPAHGRRALKVGGVYLDAHKSGGSGETLAELRFMTDLVAAGAVRPVIDRCYPLEEIVAAHRYVDEGHKAGNVAISVAHKQETR
jgi:NADPH:quinone reductase-like Zn-dependent oxidoreductase